MVKGFFLCAGALPNLTRLGYSPGMNRITALLVLLLASGLLSARAQQSADSQYLNLYGAIQQADDLAGSGDISHALTKYAEVQSQLQQFQSAFPDWNPKIVDFRLKYIAGKIADITTQIPSPSPATSATNAIPVDPASAADAELAALRGQLEAVQTENTLLLAKLKEALAAQPAMAQPGELAKAQAQIQSLMKENDLLKASAAQYHAETVMDTNAPNQLENETRISELTQERDDLLANLGEANKRLYGTKKQDLVAQMDQLTDQIRTLRERLAVVEAQPSPYTPEELALLKEAAPQLAAGDAQKKSLTQLPAGSAALVAEAQSFFTAGQFGQAEADYLKILQRDENNALVLGNLAAIEMQEGKLDAAEKHLKAALVLDPDDAFNLSRLGLLKFRQEKYDEALDVLSRAAKLNPQDPEIQNFLGLTLSCKGLRGPAEAALRRAIELNPNYADAHNNLAAIYISATPPLVELARWHYQRALDAGQPRNPELEKALAAPATTSAAP
jgi:Flp pilus assembly protein TadD